MTPEEDAAFVKALTEAIRMGRIRAESGVWVAGFKTRGFPTAMAGASLCATMLSGWLNGVMAEMAFSG